MFHNDQALVYSLDRCQLSIVSNFYLLFFNDGGSFPLQEWRAAHHNSSGSFIPLDLLLWTENLAVGIGVSRSQLFLICPFKDP